MSIGGAEHLALPDAYPRLREINVYLGWFGGLTRPLQAASLAGSLAMRMPGVRGVMKAAGDQVAGVGAGPEPGSGISWIAAEAYDAGGSRLAEVHLSGAEPYAFTADFLAWAARRAAARAGRRAGTGALGPVQAFAGLEALEAGCSGRQGLAPLREAGTLHAADAHRRARERFARRATGCGRGGQHAAREQVARLQAAVLADRQRRPRRAVEQAPAQRVERPRGLQHGRLAQREHLAARARASRCGRGSR